MHFLIVGLSHKTAPLELREKLAIPEGSVSTFLTRLLQNEDVREAILISTCNRTEAYLVSKHTQRAAGAAKKLLAEIGKVDESELEKFLYVKEAEEAIAHLFRVTASLDSMVVGEPQISAQVKEAYTQAVESRATGPTLNKLIHKSLEVAKKIRTETEIGRLPVSVSYVAVLLAQKIFGNLKETQALLIGAGEMGTVAAKLLADRKTQKIWIANRTTERAEGLAQIVGAEAIPFEEIQTQLGEVDIVIASTASQDFVIHAEEIRGAMHRRKNRPMFLIDIAVPRNIDPEVGTLENVYLYDIDHLQGIVDSNRKERGKEAQKAEKIVEQEVPLFVNTLRQMELSPTIQQLSKKFDSIRKSELEKYLSKHPGLKSDDQEALEAMSKAIVNKILHEPIILMKTEEVRDGTPKYSEILKKLFKLEGQ